MNIEIEVTRGERQRVEAWLRSAREAPTSVTARQRAANDRLRRHVLFLRQMRRKG